MKATARGSLVTSVGNGLLSLWRPTHGKLVYHLKGQSSTTNCLEVVGDQLISASQNGNVVIHSAFESPVSEIYIRTSYIQTYSEQRYVHTNIQ